MFIEQRLYTLRAGVLDEFWDLQVQRGFDVIAPIMERLVGAFGRRGSEADQVLYLFRYESFEDWHVRLSSIFDKPALREYFPKARRLMMAQENSVLSPAGPESLTPLLGNGNDWNRQDGGRAELIPGHNGRLILTTMHMSPGSIPEGISAIDARIRASSRKATSLLGVFQPIIGNLHTLYVYELASSDSATEPLGAAGTSPSIVREVRQIYELPPVEELNPLFAASSTSLPTV